MEEVRREGLTVWERKEGVGEVVWGGEDVDEEDFLYSTGFLARLRYSERLIYRGRREI